MALRPVLEYPDPRLQRLAQPVESFDERLAACIDDLIDTLAATGGIGLSAPQLGIDLRVSLVHVPSDPYGRRVYVNPRVAAKASPGLVEESCLSVPGIVGNVIRSTRLQVVAEDEGGTTFETEIDGMHAVCLQHEIDHLDGRLFIERLSWLRRFQLRHRLRNRQQVAHSA